MRRVVLGRILMVAGVVLLGAGVVGVVVGDDDAASDAAAPIASAPTTVAPTVPSTAVPSTTALPTTAPSSTAPSTTLPTTTVPPTTLPTTTVAPSSTAVATAETPEQFFTVLLDAFAGGDADTLFDRMNQATLDRYGIDQCRAYADVIAGIAQELVFVAAEPVDTWEYVTDDVPTTLTDVVAVDVERTLNGEQVDQVLHWQSVEGRFTWFTDCGDPV